MIFFFKFKSYDILKYNDGYYLYDITICIVLITSPTNTI